MVKIDKILCPTDFSEFSLCALPYAMALAERFGAELHIVHVIDDSYQYWVSLGDSVAPVMMPSEEIGEAGAPLSVVSEEMWQNSQKLMDKFLANNLSEWKGALITKILSGRPFIEIIRYAKDNAMAMIVIATHGRSGLASMLIGSVAEKVVRKAPCPVLTIRHPGHKFEMP